MSVYVDIKKNLGTFSLNVQFESGNNTLALLGASGCGKSMTLRSIAGIVKPDSGRIIIDDVTLFDSEKKIDLSPQDRKVGMLFQNYALFPNMTVLENIRTGTRRDKDKTGAEKRVREIMESFGISSLAAHHPAQLSGGQQQRTALARILVSKPNLLMFDEPFSALDNHLRFRMEEVVMDVIKSFDHSVILVSHNRDEVFRICDEVAIMENGRVQIKGEKKKIFDRPTTLQASILTGCKNNSKVRVIDSNHVEAIDWGIVLMIPESQNTIEYVGIRMHDVRPSSESVNSIRCRVVREIENQFSYTIMLRPVGCEKTLPFGMELDKEEWAAIKSPALTVSFPLEKLLALTG